MRALVDLLPEIDVVAGDNYNSDPKDPQLMGPEARERAAAGQPQPTTTRRIPMIEVPLGATEDRICGTIDIERALSDGVKARAARLRLYALRAARAQTALTGFAPVSSLCQAFEPGLLAKANRGILFVDEVNLLDDSLVDVVLDSAASGWNTVEREGISVLHPAKFIMIGSGNPEEGELRPQLLDRFGMAVTVGTIFDKDARVQLVQNRLAYESDPEAFVASCAAETEALRAQLQAARARVKDVSISRDLTLKISEVCSLINVDGLRGDITVNRAAKALAALEGSTEVTQKHVQRIITLCLSHRLRKDPLDAMDGGAKVALAFQRVFLKEERAAAMAAAAAAPKPAAAPAPAGKAAAPAKPAEKPAEKKKAGSWGGLGGFGR